MAMVMVMAAQGRTVQMPGLKEHGLNFKSEKENKGEFERPQS